MNKTKKDNSIYKLPIIKSQSGYNVNDFFKNIDHFISKEISHNLATHCLSHYQGDFDTFFSDLQHGFNFCVNETISPTPEPDRKWFQWLESVGLKEVEKK